MRLLITIHDNVLFLDNLETMERSVLEFHSLHDVIVLISTLAQVADVRLYYGLNSIDLATLRTNLAQRGII